VQVQRFPPGCDYVITIPALLALDDLTQGRSRRCVRVQHFLSLHRDDGIPWLGSLSFRQKARQPTCRSAMCG
jgi:hypothetical protein